MSLPPLTPPAFVERLDRLEHRIEEVAEIGQRRAGELETAEIHLEKRHTEVRGDLQSLKTEVNSLRLGQQRIISMLEKLTVAHGLEASP